VAVSTQRRRQPGQGGEAYPQPPQYTTSTFGPGAATGFSGSDASAMFM
jgi:hypothetical protein